MSSRRQLEVTLEQIHPFNEPNIDLEQYVTPPPVAASLVHEADLRGDLEGTVIDLGTGTGMLAIAAALRSPHRVVGLDIDAGALAVASINRDRLAVEVDFVRAAIETVPVSPPSPTTVLMNPPFGAQRQHRGADRPFLAAASDLAHISYSIHNVESRAFVEGFAADNGGRLTDTYALELDVPAQFAFHDQAVGTIDAEAYRIEWTLNR